MKNRGHEPTFPLHSPILDLMRSSVNHWSPLTRASHCMTCCWPAAATQTRVSVSPAMQPKVFGCPSCRNTPSFWAPGPVQSMLACSTPRLG